MEATNRIKANDSMQLAIFKVSEGNPGCLSFLMELMKADKFAFLKILQFDSVGLYGSKLYMLWNDCCGRDVSKVTMVLDEVHKGNITWDDVIEHVSGVYGTPFDFLERKEQK